MRNFNGKLYEVCEDCGSIVRVNKPIFGSAHICTTDDEKKKYARQIATQVAYSKRILAEAK